MNTHTQIFKVGKGYRAVGTLTEPMLISIEPDENDNLKFPSEFRTSAVFDYPPLPPTQTINERNHNMTDEFEMVVAKGDLTICPGDGADPINLTPYIRADGGDWTITNSGRMDYSSDCVEIAHPALKLYLGVDILTYIDGTITAPKNTVVAHLKSGLIIDGPGNKTINLTPYIQKETLDFALSPQTIDLGERFMYIRATHMFRISATFKPSKLTVLGNRTEVVKQSCMAYTN